MNPKSSIIFTDNLFYKTVNKISEPVDFFYLHAASRLDNVFLKIEKSSKELFVIGIKDNLIEFMEISYILDLVNKHPNKKFVFFISVTGIEH